MTVADVGSGDVASWRRWWRGPGALPNWWRGPTTQSTCLGEE